MMLSDRGGLAESFALGLVLATVCHVIDAAEKPIAVDEIMVAMNQIGASNPDGGLQLPLNQVQLLVDAIASIGAIVPAPSFDAAAAVRWQISPKIQANWREACTDRLTELAGKMREAN